MAAAAESLADQRTTFDVALLPRSDDEAVIDEGEVCGEQEGETVPYVAAQEGVVARVEFRPLDGSPVVPALLDIALLDGDAGGPDAAAGVVLGNHDRPGRVEAGAVVAREPKGTKRARLEPIGQPQHGVPQSRPRSVC